MAIEPFPTVKAIGPKPLGEILWLAVIGRRIRGDHGYRVRAALGRAVTAPSTRLPAANRSVNVAPRDERRAPMPLPSPTYSVNRLPLPDASLPSMESGCGGVERVGALTTALGAQAASRRGCNRLPRDIGGPAPTARPAANRPRSDFCDTKRRPLRHRGGPQL